MKKANQYLSIMIIVFLPILSFSQKLPAKLEQLWTVDQVRDMAKKYNLQDSVVLKK